MLSRLSASRAGHADGFTLVELLVGLTILGFLAVMLFGALRFGTRVTSVATATIDRSGEIGTAYGFLREALASAQPLPIDNTAPEPRIAFDGKPDGIDFVVTGPVYLAPGGFQRLRLRLVGDQPPKRLILEWLGTARNAATSAAPPQPSVLLDKVASIQFAYFGANNLSRPAEWQATWQAAPRLPLLIRMRVTLADGTRPPEFAVAPRLGNPVYGAP
jgi:general secretion pathway protein J